MLDTNRDNTLRIEIQGVKYDDKYLKYCAAIGMWMHQSDPSKWEELAAQLDEVIE